MPTNPVEALRRKNAYLSRLPYESPQKWLTYQQNPELAELPLTQLKRKLSLRKNLLESERAKIIGLHFQHEYSATEIAKMLTIKRVTVAQVLSRHKKKLLDQCYNRQVATLARGRVGVIPEGIMGFLRSRECLDQWKTHSLQTRVRIIREEHDVVVSVSALRNFYKAHGITFTVVQRTIKCALSAHQLFVDRVVFARAVLECVRLNQEIWYFDETSFNLWDTRNRVWQSKTDKLELMLPRSRGSSFTVLGAISSQRDICVTLVGSTTNNVTVQEFFYNFLQSENLTLRNKVIVWDNHPSHWSIDTRERLISAGAKLLFLPPSTSFFNPIERFWAWVKMKWRASTTNLMGDQPNVTACQQEVTRIMHNAPQGMILRLAQGSLALMQEWSEHQVQGPVV